MEYDCTPKKANLAGNARVCQIRQVELEFRVGSIAKKAGVGVQTLHYYERIELLANPRDQKLTTVSPPPTPCGACDS
jgi:hypothetical protein